MVLWFAGTAIVTVHLIFRDPRFDYRVLVLGALLPDLVDGPLGGARALHSITAPVVTLLVVVLATRNRRDARRRWLALPIGMFLHLVFDGAFARTATFWWPFSGLELSDEPLPSIDRGWISLVLELIGLALLAWVWHHFRLSDPERRHRFWRTGQLVEDQPVPPAPTC